MHMHSTITHIEKYVCIIKQLTKEKKCVVDVDGFPLKKKNYGWKIKCIIFNCFNLASIKEYINYITR